MREVITTCIREKIRWAGKFNIPVFKKKEGKRHGMFKKLFLFQFLILSKNCNAITRPKKKNFSGIKEVFLRQTPLNSGLYKPPNNNCQQV